MQKRICRVFVLLIFFVILVCSSNTQDVNLSDVEKVTDREDTEKILETQNEFDTELVNEKQNTEDTQSIADTQNEEETLYIDKALEVVLSNANKSFTCGYPIDETFLSDIARVYGADALYDIACYSLDACSNPKKWIEVTGKSIHVLWSDYCRNYSIYSYMIDDTHWIESDNKEATDDIVLDFVGDVNFDENWYSMKMAATKENGIYDCFDEAIKRELCSADVTLVNNEFTYGKGGTPLESKDYVFMAKLDSVKYLEMFGTDIVSVANNHVFDYDEAGFVSTLETLENAGIETVGAGQNIDEASATKFYIVNGKKIGIISATEIEKFSHFTRPATDKDAGVFKMLDPTRLVEEIIKQKSKCDYLIAYVHWGNEGTEFYEYDQVELAQVMVEAGIDAIIGGHPHRLQGCSFVESVPVAYSIGNFWFSTGALYTTIAQIRIDNSGELKLRILPCLQENLTTSIITDKGRLKKFYQYVADISKKIGIDEDGIIYNLAEPKLEGKKKDDFAYRSEKRYASHHSEYDIRGNRIDRVGNLE